MKICFVGSGKMAEALMKGLLSSKVVKNKDVISTDISTKQLAYIKKTYKVRTTKDSNGAIESSNIVILAVKPQKMAYVISSIKKSISKDKLVISIAAGITLRSLEKALPGVVIVRVMPNNPALIGEGITAISAGKHAKRKHVLIAEKIFKAVGDIVHIKEKYMDAVTALSGSGPAFVYDFLSAMIKSGTALGLSKKNSEELSKKTMLGAIKTVISTGETPEKLIAMVASPGGTTIAGLKSLKKNKFAKISKKAIIEASKRSQQISSQYKI